MVKLRMKRISAFLLATLLILSGPCRQLCYALDEETSTEAIEENIDDLFTETEEQEEHLDDDLTEKEEITEEQPIEEKTIEEEPKEVPKLEVNEEPDVEEPPKAEPKDAQNDTPQSTSLTVSIEWIDGDNYYKHRPGAVTFKIQRAVFLGTSGQPEVDKGWQDVPLSPATAWMSTVVLWATDDWSDKYLLDIPYTDETLSDGEHYGYRAVEYIYHFGHGIDVLADAMYEYRHYSINSYEPDANPDGALHYRTRCVNAIRIYSVPTGDNFDSYVVILLSSAMLFISCAAYMRIRRKKC